MAKSSNGKYRKVNTNHSKGKPYGTMGYNQQFPLKQGSKGSPAQHRTGGPVKH
jgi:hypothetical protein